MPTYSFRCGDCHDVQDRFYTSVGMRPNTLDCLCGGLAEHFISVHPKTEPTKTYKSKDFTGLSLHDFSCTHCGNNFDELVDHGAGHSPSDGAKCPACGSHSTWVISVNIDRDSERYPRFDRALKMWLMSKQHRKDVCANPRRYGLDMDEITPVDGDWDEDRHISSQDREDAADEAEFNRYLEELEEGEAFSEYRRARDMGAT